MFYKFSLIFCEVKIHFFYEIYTLYKLEFIYVLCKSNLCMKAFFLIESYFLNYNLLKMFHEIIIILSFLTFKNCVKNTLKITWLV